MREWWCRESTGGDYVSVGGVYVREWWWCLCESAGAERVLVVFM